VAPKRKFEPFTVSVKLDPPAVAETGLRLVIEGTDGALMAKTDAVDGFPPEFATVILALPLLAIRLADTAAVTCVALTKVVTSAEPFQLTTAPLMKFVPFTVSVKADPPAVAEVGLRLVIVGVGTVILKADDDDALPPAFATVILALPALAISAAGTAAVNCVELTKVVTSPVPFQLTVAPERKLVPFTVSVNADPPSVAELGLRLVMLGVGMPIGNAVAADGLPPVFVTVILALPPLAISAAGTAAVTCMPLTNVVVSAAPFQFTTALLRKFVPFTVSVNAAPPAVAELGLRLVMVGVGMVIENVVAVDALPPLLVTVTLALPTPAIRLAATVAVTCVLLTNVVARFDPFHCTVALLRKPVPFTVSVNADPPALAEFGLRLVIVGVGMLTGNTVAVDVFPPAFITVMLALPPPAINAAVTMAVNCVLLTSVVASAVPFHCTTAPVR
jgi:hypothetical protein